MKTATPANHTGNMVLSNHLPSGYCCFMTWFRKQQSFPRIGCGYIFIQGIVACLLLMLNGYVVSNTIHLDWGEELRIPQAIQMVLPVVMLVIELWLFDVFFTPTTRNPT
jgi:hypothetical protein